MDRTAPDGRVVGIDIIPAQPPKGVSTIQGNFLSPAVQEEVKKFLKEADIARARPSRALDGKDADERLLEEGLDVEPTRYFESESRTEHLSGVTTHPKILLATSAKGNRGKPPVLNDKMVDVVLSDMSAPWEQTDGFWKRSLSNPYYRMMNTSGMTFRDHAGSMVGTDLSLFFLLCLLAQSCLPNTPRENIEVADLTCGVVDVCRTCAMQLSDLPLTLCASVGILCVNSTKGSKTRRWNCACDHSLPKSIERSLSHHAA